MFIFMPFDTVRYVGRKFSSELRSKVGVIAAKVQNEDGVYSVDFGASTYVMGVGVLEHMKVKDKQEQFKLEQDVYSARKPKTEEV